jgi:hypothetical protein
MPDWFPKIANHLLTGIVLVFIIQSMVRKAAVTTKDGSGKVLGYSLWLGVLGLIIFSIFAFLPIYGFRHHVDGLEVLAIICGVLMAFGLFILLYAIFTKIEIDESKITSRVFWRRSVTLYWSEVETVDFIWTKQFRFRGFDGRTIRVDMMIGGLNRLLEAMAKHLPVEKYLDAMRVYWKATQNYEKSVGSVVAVPPSDLAKVSGTLESKRLEEALERISRRVEEGFGKKEIGNILKKLKKTKPNESLALQSPVLFRGMPTPFFLFLYVLENGPLQLNWFASPLLTDGIKDDMEKAGATDVLVELGEDEEEDEGSLETAE